MEKISITVKIPALDSTYDFIVPNNMSVKIPHPLSLDHTHRS